MKFKDILHLNFVKVALKHEIQHIKYNIICSILWTIKNKRKQLILKLFLKFYIIASDGFYV